MQRLLVAVVAVLSIGWAATPVSADWVFGAYVGTATTTKSWLTVTQPRVGTAVRFEPVAFAAESFRMPLYYGYRLAYFPQAPGWLGVEGEFVHLKVFTRTGRVAAAEGLIRGARVAAPMPIESVVQRFSLSHGENMALFNAVLRRPVNGDFKTARLTLLARVGAGPTLPHVESTIDGASEERYQRGRWAMQVAGGIELRTWSRLKLLAEYKFTRCRQSVDVVNGGTATTLLRTHHLAFGATWKL